MPKPTALLLALRPFLNAWGWDHQADVEAAVRGLAPALILPLTDHERAELFRDDGAKTGGGFQNLVRKLQAQVTGHTIALYPADLERIPRYAFDYHGGGWQNRMVTIFRRTLGPNLGREEQTHA